GRVLVTTRMRRGRVGRESASTGEMHSRPRCDRQKLHVRQHYTGQGTTKMLGIPILRKLLFHLPFRDLPFIASRNDKRDDCETMNKIFIAPTAPAIPS